MREKSRLNRLEPWLAFLIPIAALCVLYVGTHLFPVGNKTLLILDLRQQYTAFFSWWKRALDEGQGAFFSLYKGFGGETVGLIAYYLLSPLNVLFLLAPTRWMPETVAVVTLLKVGLCGASMCALQRRALPEAPVWLRLCLAVSYALMAYNIVYQQNLMWLDGVALLPLVALGLMRIVQDRSPWTYLVSLTAAIWANYYIGTMLCLFSVLFFAFLMLSEKRERTLRVFAMFALASMLAGALSAALLLPVLHSLAGGKAMLGPWGLAADAGFTFQQFASRLFSGTFQVSEYAGGLPNVFVGMLVLCGVGVFFAHRAIALREKLAAGLLLAALYVSFGNHMLNLLWHGLNEPAWYSYRQSFVFSFVLILLAGRGWAALCTRRERVSMIVGPGLALALLLVSGINTGVLGGWRAIMNLTFLVGASLCIVLWMRYRKRMLAMTIVALTCADMGLHAWLCLRQLQYEPREVYARAYDRMEAMRSVLPDVAARTETNTRYALNDPMLFGYWGLTHFSSSEKTFVRAFLRDVGFVDTGMWAGYGNGGTAAIEQLLGVRTLFMQSPYADRPSYTKIASVGDSDLLENPRALPLGFVADAAVLGAARDADNPFERTNAMWAEVVGRERVDLLRPVPMDDEPVLENLVQTADSIRLGWRRVDPNLPASVTYALTAPDSGMLYLYSRNESALYKAAEVLVNGHAVLPSLEWWGYGTMPIGAFAPGQRVEVCFRLGEQSIIPGTLLCYTEDSALLADLSDEVRAHPTAWTRIGGDTIEGSATSYNDHQALLLTVPAVDGWSARIDGKQVDIQKVWGALIALPLTKGTHEIRLYFTPPGLLVGGAISSSAAVLAALWFVLWRRRRRATQAISKGIC